MTQEEFRASTEKDCCEDDAERLRAILETAVDGILTIDSRGVIESVNAAAERLFGYEKGELLGQNVSSLMPSPHKEMHKDYLGQYFKTGEKKIIGIGREVVGRRRDGTTFPMSLAVSELRLGDEILFTGIVRDISDIKRAETRLRLLTDALPALISYVTTELRYGFCNQAHERWFGLEQEQLEGASLREILGEAAFATIDAHFDRALAGEEHSFECEIPFARGGARYVHAILVPHMGSNGDGDVLGFYLLMTDRSELRRFQEQARRQENLAAVGRLAAGIAHEIGNPLSSISAVLQTALRKTEDDYLQRKLRLIEKPIERIDTTIRQLMNIARPPQQDWRRCNLNDLLTEALDILRFDSRARTVEIETRFDGDLPETVVMPDLMSQVFINLALNAFDALEPLPPDAERKLEVATRVGASSNTPLLEVAFQDSGPGVTSENRSRIFEPFFTTKEVGKGTGLGLSVSYGIVKEHGGTIRVDHPPEGGARFTVELPPRTTAPREG